MNLLRSSLAMAAACGLIFSAAAPAFAAPTDYQITGTVTVLSDTNVALITNKKENFDFARGADTKLPDGVKVGDKVTVHYTMTAGTVDAKPESAAKAKAAPKGKTPAVASPTP